MYKHRFAKNVLVINCYSHYRCCILVRWPSISKTKSSSYDYLHTKSIISCDDFVCAFSIPSNIVWWQKVHHFNQHILAWWQEPIPWDRLHCDGLSVCSIGNRFPCHTHQIRKKVSNTPNQIIILYSVEILSGWFCKVTTLFWYSFVYRMYSLTPNSLLNVP